MQQGRVYPSGDFNFPEFDFSKINKRTILLFLGGVIAVWLLSGIYFVGQQEEGVVRRFGKFVYKVSPGPHYHIPWPVEKIDKPKIEEVRSIEIGFRTAVSATATSSARYIQVPEEALMLTGDENIVDLNVIVQYRIRNSEDYLFRIQDPELTVRNAAEAAIRLVIGTNSIDDALTENKTGIQNDTMKLLTDILDSYNAGIFVTGVNLQDVRPPTEVADAFRDVASAIQDKNRLINEAEGYRNNVIPKARGEAQQVLREAEAYLEERVRRSQGDANRFLAILKEYNKSKDVTKKRLYIETMESILPGMEKYIIQTDGSGGLFNILQMKKEGQ